LAEQRGSWPESLVAVWWVLLATRNVLMLNKRSGLMFVLITSRLTGKCAGNVRRILMLWFENVGGEIFDASLARINHQQMIALCGMISGYNGEISIRNSRALLTMRLMVQVSL
jgi:hypothetical protein